MNGHPRCREQGAALMICLMVLAVLTLLGTTAILNTATETKITHTTRTAAAAFYAAEAGIEHILALAQGQRLKADDVITSQALRGGAGQYGPRYRVTILDVEQFDWGVTVLTVQSVGYGEHEQVRRVLRASIQIVEETPPSGRFELEYPGAS